MVCFLEFRVLPGLPESMAIRPRALLSCGPMVAPEAPSIVAVDIPIGLPSTSAETAADLSARSGHRSGLDAALRSKPVSSGKVPELAFWRLNGDRRSLSRRRTCVTP